MGGENGPVNEVRLLLGEQALEPEQKREAPTPFDRGLLRAAVELGHRGVQRASARRLWGECLGGGLAFIYESLARELFGARNRVRTRKGGVSTHAILEG